MNTGEIRPSGGSPAFLPLRRSTGTEFSKQLRAQLFAELSGTTAPQQRAATDQTNAANRSTNQKPALCRVSSYLRPGLPSPTTSFMLGGLQHRLGAGPPARLQCRAPRARLQPVEQVRASRVHARPLADKSRLLDHAP